MRMRWVGHVVGVWEMRSAYRSLVGGPEGERPVQKLCQLQAGGLYTIKTDLKESNNVTAEWLTLLLRVRAVQESNFGPKTGYPVFVVLLNFLRRNAGIVPSVRTCPLPFIL
jgi:hypothetical protein